LEDLETVARFLVPEGDADSIMLLAVFAKSSPQRAAAIQHVLKRAGLAATKRGSERTEPRDIAAVIQQAALPSDLGLKATMAEPGKSGGPRRPARAFSHPRNEPSKMEGIAPVDGGRQLKPVCLP